MLRPIAILVLLGQLACAGRPDGGTGPAPDPGGPLLPGAQARRFTVATVERYPNGLSLVQHPLGDSAAATLLHAGWTGGRFRDAEVVPELFTGPANFPDLLVFGGHGTHVGPALTTDPGRTMLPANYFWGRSLTQPLRWFFNDSCLGLNDGVTHPEEAPRWDSVPGSYWFLGAWLQAMNWGRGGMHAYLGHRGDAWAALTNTGSAYAIARSLQGESIGQAWFEAAALDMAQGQPGILPAVLSAYDPVSGKDWFNESLAAPWEDPRVERLSSPIPAEGHEHLAYHYAVIGFPVLPGRGVAAPAARGWAARGGLDLSAVPHRSSPGATAQVFHFDVQAVRLQDFLAATGLPVPTFEILHLVQYGRAAPVRAGRLLPLLNGDGKALVLRVDSDDRVLRATLRH